MAGKAASHWPITLTNGAVALLNIFLPLALVRFLSLDEMGRYNIFFLYVMLLPALYLTAGLNNGLYFWAGKYPEAKSEVRQSWTLMFTITFALTALGLVCVPWAAPRFKMTARDLQLILLCIPFIMTASFFEDLLIARGKIWAGAWFGSLFNVLRTLSLLVAAWWTRNLETVFWVFVAGTFIRSVVGWFLVRNGGEIQWMFSWAKSKNVLRYAFPVSLAGVAALTMSHVDQLILSFRLSPATFALYAMGCLSVPPIEIFETSVNRVMIPRLSEAFNANELSQASELLADAISELFRFLLPATLGLIIYAEPIVRMLFTERYMPAAAILRIFAVSYLFYSFPFSSVARARGDGLYFLRVAVVFAALCSVVTWFAAARWNAMGALGAVLASQFSLRLYSFFYARKHLTTSFAKFIPLKDMGIQIGIAAVATSMSLLTRPLFSNPQTWFFVTGLIFTLMYLGATYAVSLRRHVTSTGPIHVLELVQTLCLGGLERTVYSLSHALNQNKRFKIVVATYDHPAGKPSLVPLFTEAGIPLVQWQKKNGFSLRSIYELLQLTFSEEIHILHVHDLGPLIYGSLTKLCSLGRVRLVLTLHTLLDIEKNPRYRFYYKVFLRFADRIIAVSPGVRAGLLALGIGPERVEVIANGVTFPPLPPGIGSRNDKIVWRKQLMPGLMAEHYNARWLVCLARLNSGKGQDVVLDVWQALPVSVRAELVLFFVGQETDAGYVKALRAKLMGSPDADRVVIAGASDRPQEWLGCADMFISGSQLEGMPLAPLEAAGQGLPTILSDIEGHQFLKTWAHYFNPAKPEEGASKIVQLLAVIRGDGGVSYVQRQWDTTVTLRLAASASVMSDSYAETFELA